MFLSLKTLYRKRTVIWPFYFYTIIRTLSDLWLKNGKSKLVNDNLNYFKLKKFIVALESKTAIIEKLINNYLNICSDRGNDVQILF
ncbi:hypothetical protein GQX46_10395 [Staphylococcus aureus]|uniref:Uncharacterized protein n=1 Tax=Staphylococcus aureus TaxID=1280 RepID=A0AAP7ELN1_STAAU|nr:hypothetical protein [Staphylococcus aureus]NUY17341.1 hypothetical protein [Staphylococcus aureus]NUY69415.1 hypothetical protein [Staphylococcus aureus]